MDIAYPFNPPTQTYISSDFGYRDRDGHEGHWGIDIPANTGVNLYSAVNGEVVLNSDSEHSYYGYYIIIEATDDFNSVYKSNKKLMIVYMHMDEASDLSVGTQVNSGDLVGTVGNTGDSSGSHLHFAILSDFVTNGEDELSTNSSTFVDPMLFYTNKTFTYK